MLERIERENEGGGQIFVFFFSFARFPGGRPTFSGWIRGVAFGVVDTRVEGSRGGRASRALSGGEGHRGRVFVSDVA